MSVLFVISGGFLGAICRFAVSQWFIPRAKVLPVGTLLVNWLGSFLLGGLVGSAPAESWQLFVGTGFMGAFTTFSTFKWENVQMIARGETKSAIVYLALTYCFGILLAFLGYWLGLQV